MLYCLVPQGHQSVSACCGALLPTGTTTVPSSALQPHCAPPLPPSPLPQPTHSSLLCILSPHFSTSAVSLITVLSFCCYFGFPCWPLSHPILETVIVSIPAPVVHLQGAASFSSAPPQMSSLSLCCQTSSPHLHGYLFLSHLVIGSSGSSRDQEPSILSDLQEGLGLLSSESKFICLGVEGYSKSNWSPGWLLLSAAVWFLPSNACPGMGVSADGMCAVYPRCACVCIHH